MRIRLMLWVVIALIGLFPNIGAAEITTTPTGFYYPVGSDVLNVSSCGQWLERPTSLTNPKEHNDCYPIAGVYHIGADMKIGYGTDVRAIADGEVVDWSESGWSNDGTNNNIALLVKHRSAERGEFVALYGHVLRSGAKGKGSSVKAGDVIARIGRWNGGDHLHFGILSPGLPAPLASGYGRWPYNEYGKTKKASNGQDYYDNGFIDQIDFIAHNGPDNSATRQTESQPNSITPQSSWFLPLCWQAGTPDARCDLGSITTYFDCTIDKSSLCADSPSAWSALGSSGKGSGPGGGGGGGSYNLNQDTDIMDPATGVEWIAGQKTLLPSQVVNIRVKLKSEGGDVRNYIQAGKDTIETDYYVRLDSGSWAFFRRQYTKVSSLGAGTHTETSSYTIPSGVSEISFRVKVDAENEVSETNEGDNWSRIETFKVDNYSWLIPIINIILED